ncbi:lactosylceramide 4-alpha-galactosyltransferase-like isoform X2 [Ornithodoros turicata]|uniref:lactosylceramide 4-alpha-galactosyltransferase-like isoform X2 n=1 Tax=Ornithodoros turicata TaxID=34597 RepID=UPI0031396452
MAVSAPQYCKKLLRCKLLVAVLIALLIISTRYRDLENVYQGLKAAPPEPVYITYPAGMELLEKASVVRGKSVFFVDASSGGCVGHRLACAIESASNHSGDVILVTNRVPSPDCDALRLLYEIAPKFRVATVDFGELFDDTPLLDWYDDRSADLEQDALHYALSLVILWKYGGVYFDNDIVVINQIKGVSNAIGRVSPVELGLDAMFFYRHHRFLEHCMLRLAHNGVIYRGHRGGVELARTLRQHCRAWNEEGVISCGNLHLLPSSAFYPVKRDEADQFYRFPPLGVEDDSYATSYMVKLWPLAEPGRFGGLWRDSAYDVLTRTHCPFTRNETL